MGSAETTRTQEPVHQAPATVSASVIDLFCGVGGLTAGLLEEGLQIAAGIDLDEECRYPYEFNNDVPFLRKDVSELKAKDLLNLFVDDVPRVLVGCAPCQPFSSYNAGRPDERWSLVERFAELIEEVAPDVVSMENVPRLLNFENGAVFESFVERLEAADYEVWSDVVCAADYGVPQRRNRLVLLASKHGPIKLEDPIVPRDEWITVRSAIGNLQPIAAGSVADKDRLHRSSSLSAMNQRRIKAAKPGGTWRDWDDELVTECHRSDTGKSYPSVYGRMGWNEPAPTITTQFYGFGNGRFGHPAQDRALSLREGAILQSFDPDYRFVRPGDPVRMKTVGRLIGNAVPVLLGRAIGRSIVRHLRDQGLA